MTGALSTIWYNMINFLLNNKNISTELPSGMVVLDFLRHSQRLVSTKEGCREGDCGACLILVGKWNGDTVSYQPVNSCLLPLAELDSKHVVTIEGLNNDELNPIQAAIVSQGATQCGYCTPGIVISLTGFFLSKKNFKTQEAIASLDGNLCRCTGYQSIKRAANQLCQKFTRSDVSQSQIQWLVKEQILPNYFLQIPERLQQLPSSQIDSSSEISQTAVVVGGGTDLWVQKPVNLYHADLTFLSDRTNLKGIQIEKNCCYIGATTSIEDMKNSPILQAFFPKIHEHFKLIASTPIRHRATVGGNIVNASPIGDLTIFFLALGASITLSDGQNQRELALKDFFKGYKQLNKHNNELVECLSFPQPVKNTFFNFEKVSKRTNLDIASVNSAIQITVDNGIIQQVLLSAGGVAPIPFYLTKTVNYLIGKELKVDSIREAGLLAQSEISPISDIRGSINYKRLLLRQLIYAHFITLFPKQIKMEELR